jgi:hypothetical protein
MQYIERENAYSDDTKVLTNWRKDQITSLHLLVKRENKISLLKAVLVDGTSCVVATRHSTLFASCTADWWGPINCVKSDLWSGDVELYYSCNSNREGKCVRYRPIDASHEHRDWYTSLCIRRDVQEHIGESLSLWYLVQVKLHHNNQHFSIWIG